MRLPKSLNGSAPKAASVAPKFEYLMPYKPDYLSDETEVFKVFRVQGYDGCFLLVGVLVGERYVAQIITSEHGYHIFPPQLDCMLNVEKEEMLTNHEGIIWDFVGALGALTPPAAFREFLKKCDEMNGIE